MESKTENKQHWVVDNPITVKTNGENGSRFIIDSIENEITKRKKALPSDSLFVEKLLNEGEENSNFLLPNFSINYTISSIRNSFSHTQKWIGYIVRLKTDSFIAKLEDINNPNTYEIGEFEFREISPEDKELISLGTVFYWSIGYANYNGQVKKESIIRFKRTAGWKEDDVDFVADRSSRLDSELKWE